MKKRFKNVLSVLLIMTLFFLLFGCKNFKMEEIIADNLIKTANITASDNNKEVKKVKDSTTKKWSTKKQGASIIVDFSNPTMLNTIVIKEPTDNITEFNIYYKDTNGEFVHIYKQDRIDKYRMCVIEDIETNSIKIVFDKFEKRIEIEEIEIFYMKNSKANFRVNAYIDANMSEDNQTEISKKYTDPDYFGWFSTLTDVTIINNVNLNTNGEITYRTGKENLINDINLIRLMNPNIKIHITVLTGLVDNDFKGNNKAMVKLVKDEVLYKKALNNIGNMVKECGLDGVDYDWEIPQLPWEWNTYDRLIIDTKKVINGAEVSVALWPYKNRLSKEARASIDTVNIMAYDQFDKRYGDHSSIYETGLEAMEYFLSLGFSKLQLRLGIPFYGRTSDEYNIWPSYNTSYGKWGNVTENFTYTNNKNEQKTSTIYLNGYAMVRDKTALALAYDLGGIMIFRSETDIGFTNQFSLHKAVAETINQRIV